jgi:Kef-type K+ transport system membrane component KefB
MSSSIAVIIPSLEEKGLMSSEIGTIIVGSVIIEDVGSLFILSLLLQTANPTTALPLPAFIAIVLLSIVGLKSILPRIEAEFFKRKARTGFEEKLQFVFILLMSVAVYFEFLGMHAIVAGFLVGLILSESIRHEHIEAKLHAFSYGIFIPFFFLLVGIETDLTVFQKAGDALILTLAMTGGLVSSKVLSGILAGRILGFSGKKNLLMGFASIPERSTSLTVAFTALELGLLDSSIQVGIVFLSIVTVLIAPLVVGKLAKSAVE